MKVSAAIPVMAVVGMASAQNCPPVGQKNADGLESCDPKVQYPNLFCVAMGDCFFLEGGGAVIPSTTSGSAAPTTTSCPAPGTTDAAGEYSCNPAHQYPDGQVCVLKGNCYFLEGTGLNTASASQAASSTASCPAPGSTSTDGDYSCNPAHQYPDGQVCVLKGGCYFLEGTGLLTSTPSGQPTKPTAAPTVVTAGGAHQTALGGLAAAVGFVAAML
ncbi:hypothetical protein NLU13_6823 [Sarocladium strictum]|uniref:Uncharacterized protein n=1 Tax=Sarocladium strictum TaxID=5046 RepID=A0AA39GEN4_SARSR|nr:hypothetical protein NLU13_6823 [Sarocladium strictum]